jgi:hypothetical protein
MDKIINLLINNWTKGVDTYTHNGSTWLIFTEQKSWVIELTESKTLWYNYNFFKELFSLTSMDVVDNQHYITKWVEDNVINKVSDIHFRDARDRKQQFEDTLKNGVKKTKYNQSFQEPKFKEVLKNGIIMSNPRQYVTNKILDDAIETGVKKTQGTPNWTHDQKVSNVIDNGVKETHDDAYHHKSRVDNVVKNGVKETKTPGKDGDIMSTIEWMEENKSTSYTKMIDDVIEKGVKETKACYYKDPKTNLMFIKWDYQIDNVIETGIKEGKINDIIDNRVKVSGTFVGGNRQKENIESVIGYGTKNPTV